MHSKDTHVDPTETKVVPDLQTQGMHRDDWKILSSPALSREGEIFVASQRVSSDEEQ